MMNIGAVSCIAMGAVFAVMSFLVALLKERGAMLIGGFNTLPKGEREKYDKARMSIDQRNAFLIWAAIFTAGAVASFFISRYAAIFAFAAWLILFFKDVHLDTEKAFGKYRL